MSKPLISPRPITLPAHGLTIEIDPRRMETAPRRSATVGDSAQARAAGRAKESRADLIARIAPGVR